MFNGLKCYYCGNGELKFRIAYSGADWDSCRGRGSGYGHEVSIVCPKCERIYTIGYCQNSWDVVPPKGVPYD